MTNETNAGPWVIRRVEPDAYGAATKTYFVNAYKGNSLWNDDLRFARRFSDKATAAREAASFLKRWPDSWGAIRLVRLFRKVTPCA